MTDKQKIEILQQENARLRKELQRINYLTEDGIMEEINETEKERRELLIELKELREKYRKTTIESSQILKELRQIAKIEGVKKRRFFRRI